MKVLHFFKTSLPSTTGGVENVIDQICRGTRKYGVQSSVLALTNSKSFPDFIEFNGYSVYLLRRDFHIASTDFALSAFRRFSALAGEHDVIHYHFPWPFMDIVHFATRINKPSLLTYHSDIVKQKYLLELYRPLMNAFFNSINKIIVTSPNYLIGNNYLKRFYNKISIIPIGIDYCSRLSESHERIAYWRSILGTRFFLFIGVLRYYKGLHVLLEANEGRDLPVVIVGDGPLMDKLKADCYRRGLKNTFFLGAIDDIDKAALLSLCFCFVFPSNLRSEAFGVSLLEAAMYGKPLISCEIGTGTSYININNETGFVVPPNNSTALATAMDELWHNPSMATKFGANALFRYNQLFTAEKMSERYSEIYFNLLNSN